MKAEITTLTPVHIGNGITLIKNIDFIQSDNLIGIIDEKKVLDLIGEENVNQWVSAIDKGGNAFIELIDTWGWEKNDLDSISSRIEKLETRNNTATQLKEIYRNPITGIVIPGSSIKGAIKTAIFNSLATDDEISNIGYNDLKNLKGKFDFSYLDRKFFGQNANEKSTRFLKVRDVQFENTAASIYEVQILNKYHRGWQFKREQTNLIETIPPLTNSIFEIIIDVNLLNANLEKNFSLWPKNKISYLQNGTKGICNLVNEFSKRLIDYEINDLSKEILIEGSKIISKYEEIYKLFGTLEPNSMILRIGGNSGYIFTTGQRVSYLNTNKVNDFQFKELRKFIQRKYYDMGIWPKTRKTTTNGDLFGFVKIEFKDN